ncbi:carbon-nitrogen hydrolase family protein [Paenibacillus sp. FJAT-27812]|uniref:carbon-nitrogen hydrolase family protein n=1 Tax=Paenibacillus sp. FJAT-27812 TaxID=1684143 RepID=UPI0006A7A5BF|nr:carbon-nitrogen hydrolase family protein [Paenibacillus sp. FJAT-27812]
MNVLSVATIQYELTFIESEEQFWKGLTSTISKAAEQGAELVVFPEYMTAHLLSLKPAMSHKEACHYLSNYTAKYMNFFLQSSRAFGIAILGGTHICHEEDGFVNNAYLFFPDGRVEVQTKLHLTPEERNSWSLVAGDRLNMIESKWGKLAITTCYDIEFPELARMAAEQGAQLLLCPSYTDSAFGYYRVRHCAQARAIENQLFVVLSGMVGSLPEGLLQVDQGYCQAGVFSPCDYPFSEQGILQVGVVNESGMALAELDFAMLQENREHGVVAPFYDRRPSLYQYEPVKLLLGEC